MLPRHNQREKERDRQEGVVGCRHNANDFYIYIYFFSVQRRRNPIFLNGGKRTWLRPTPDEPRSPLHTNVCVKKEASRQGGKGEEGRGGERRRKKGRGEQESEKAGEEKEGGSLDPHPMRKKQEQRGKGYGAGAPIPPLPLQAAKSRIKQSRVGWSRVE